ncbi:hypothetical protein MSG28_011575 [Choristoneura fumiferana]|uniref:Uncharacterized protein n=1 Tax=Choristoneura fumiferana TaxID=7141 RepID=A0ACC0JNS3_CHOFU|nr:hypothetical protein MSG28_011575 [Choristoneura fumiferana]
MSSVAPAQPVKTSLSDTEQEVDLIGVLRATKGAALVGVQFVPHERAERTLPAVTTGTRTYNYESSTNSTPGYSKVKSSKVTKDLSQNVEELDSLLDDLQKDQERQLYKSGYTSDTAESTSFDYKRSKAPSSGYSTLKREERMETSSWNSSPPPPPTVSRAAEVRQEVYREEKTAYLPDWGKQKKGSLVKSRITRGTFAAVPVSPQPVPPVCTHCHHQTSSSTGTLSRSGTPMNKVTTTVKTYTYEVPADQDPTTVPIPTHSDHTYVSDHENVRTLSRTTTGRSPSPAPPGGCVHCSHCNTRVRRDHYSATDVSEHTTERMVYPAPTSHEVTLLPSTPPAPTNTHLSPERNGHGPYGPTTYKYSETTYSSQNTTERGPSPAPFPRPHTPAQRDQQPPKRLDDLLADFPEARFPTQPDGVVRRKVEVTHENSSAAPAPAPAPAARAPAVGSKNVAGPAVYYPPGHTPFAKKDTPVAYQAGGSSAAMQGGGAYASGRGMYEYESGSRSKEKHTEKKTAVPICLPLCCAMPCVIM